MDHGLIDAWMNGWIYRAIPIDELLFEYPIEQIDK